MDLAELQRLRDWLEARADSTESWLALSTFLVVAGLILEYWFPVRHIIKTWREEHKVELKVALELIGGALVTVGVAGELILQSHLSTINSKTRSVSHQIEGYLNTQVGNANIVAASASERASQNEKRAAELEIENKKLERSVALANERAANSAKAAQDEAIARLQLEERIAPRRITEQDTAKIIEALKPFAGTRFLVSAIMNDAESGEYAFQLDKTLKAAGWNCIDDKAIQGVCISQKAYTVPAPRGIWITGNPIFPLATERTFSQALTSLQHVLSLLAETRVPVSADSNCKIGELDINVGFKPIPVKSRNKQ